jgi:hypothetical protein
VRSIANDVVTGAPKDNGTAGADVGSIGVFDGGGGAGAHTLASAVRVYGRAASDQLGARVTVADVTGDGYADVLAGAPGDDRAGDGAGAVYLVAGDATLTWNSAVDVAAYASWTGLAAGDGVGGDALPTPGDVDGDGGLDLGVACEGCGAAWIVLQADLRPGAASLSAATHTFAGDPGDFASAMVLDGDLDGDGADEVVLGGDGADVTGENSGVVWVYRWSAAWGPTLGTADASATIAGALAGDSLGTGLGGGGDVDGDGRDDLVLGAVTADGPYVDGGALWFLPGW